MEIIDALKKFGFTRQEALLYVTLLKHGDLTGYEAAKIAGISRSNAYGALAGLVAKGRVLKSDQKTPRFTALPKKELLLNLAREFAEARDFLDRELPDRVDDEVPYVTVSGVRQTLDKMANMILLAKERVYVSMHSEALAPIRGVLKDGAARGLRIVIISDQDPKVPGAEFYQKGKEPGHMKIIVDTSELFTGLVLPDREGQGLYSRNRHLVDLMREAFLNEITLISACP